MKVKLNILESMLMRIAIAMDDVSIKIKECIHRKYDRNWTFNTHTYNSKKCDEIIFSNEEES